MELEEAEVSDEQAEANEQEIIQTRIP